MAGTGWRTSVVKMLFPQLPVKLRCPIAMRMDQQAAARMDVSKVAQELCWNVTGRIQGRSL